MLYNPNWKSPETKADPLSLESLIAWLEKQPADESYVYDCNGSCLLAQYFTAIGFKNVGMGASFFFHGDGRRESTDLPSGFNAIAQDTQHIFKRLGPPTRTFGAALERARKLAA